LQACKGSSTVKKSNAVASFGYFSRMCCEGFSFYFGGLGVDLCRLDAPSATTTVGDPLHPWATVRDDCAVAVPMGSAAKVEVSNVA